MLPSSRSASGFKHVALDNKASASSRYRLVYKQKCLGRFDCPVKAAKQLAVLHPEYVEVELAKLKQQPLHQGATRSVPPSVPPSVPLTPRGEWWTRQGTDTRGFDLFGIRLQFEFVEQVVFPSTKLARRRYLKEFCAASLLEHMSAATLTRFFRSVLQLRANSEDHDVRRLWKQVYGTVRQKTRLGTVVGYFPISNEHTVVFDDDPSLDHSSMNIKPQKAYQFNLLARNDWRRIPWPNNVLDDSDPLGERALSELPFSFGPECPKCKTNLGIGISAWSRCHMCGLNEPGVMWSCRFSAMRDEVWDTPVYDEEEDED